MGKIVEVDEEELLRDRTLRGVLNKMLSNPKAKLLVQQAHKLVDPQAITPELDQTNGAASAVDEVKGEVASLRAQLATEKTEREQAEKLLQLGDKIERGLNKLRSKGVTEEGIAGVRKIMDDEGITNPDIAWDHFEKLHPPQNPVSNSGSGAWNFMDMQTDSSDDLKRLVETKGENVPLLDKMARDALNDVRGQSRR